MPFIYISFLLSHLCENFEPQLPVRCCCRCRGLSCKQSGEGPLPWGACVLAGWGQGRALADSGADRTISTRGHGFSTKSPSHRLRALKRPEITVFQFWRRQV